VPSAGARHAFETILLANRVDGLPVGLYRYAAIEHGLLPLGGGVETAAQLRTACKDQPSWRPAPRHSFWVAVGGAHVLALRGARIPLPASGRRPRLPKPGLGAEQLGCGICPIAAFDDEALNTALGLDGEEQFVIYLATLGKKM
jgi:hypothetical protein